MNTRGRAKLEAKSAQLFSFLERFNPKIMEISHEVVDFGSEKKLKTSRTTEIKSHLSKFYLATLLNSYTSTLSINLFIRLKCYVVNLLCGCSIIIILLRFFLPKMAWFFEKYWVFARKLLSLGDNTWVLRRNGEITWQILNFSHKTAFQIKM